MAKLDRRSVLVGSLAGVGIGGAAGLLSGMASRPGSSAVPPPTKGKTSYAQQGEDLVIQNILETLKVAAPTYLDIGAYDPITDNNTYLFYLGNGHGVVVEPNPTYAAKLRKERSRDVVLEAGIGVSSQAEADYYVVRGRPQLNTFSKERADELASMYGKETIEKVLKVPLYDINGVIDKHLAGRAPDVLSTDVEGLDLAILKTLDFGRFRPLVVCVETSAIDGSVEEDILALMRSKGYSIRGGSFVNTIFLDDRALSSRDGGTRVEK